MGMFDWMKCEYPLPLPAAQDLLFQTKDLGNCLDHYLITQAGELLLLQWRYEPVPETERSRSGFPLLRKVLGSEERILQHWTGTLNFYGDTTVGQLYMIPLGAPRDPLEPPPPPWYEFDAVFREGQLQSITGSMREDWR